MVQNPHLNPVSFFLEGGRVDVLLIHGFTGSPPEMRLVGDYLHQRGLTVSGPRLPGHGTKLEDMNRCRWADWTDHTASALAELQDGCDILFVGGLSMGALLALHLAARRPEIAGVMLYAPAIFVRHRFRSLIPLAKYVTSHMPKSKHSDYHDPEAQSRVWSYDDYPVRAAHELLKLTSSVKRLLPQVTQPLLIIHSSDDQTAHPDSAQFVYERVGSTDKDLLMLHDSGHVITVDAEWQQVAEKSYRFIKDHLPGPV
jgi:carboxylesterase